MNIATNLTNIQDRINAAAHLYERPADDIKLLAMSKKQSVDAMREAIDAGQITFAENYVQEACQKILALSDYLLEWHFTGAVQSNKTKKIAEQFSWVHSVTMSKIAHRLSEQRPVDLPPLNICLEVNVDDAPNKVGVPLAELSALAKEVASLPNIRLRGLMAIPELQQTFEKQRVPLRKLREAFEKLNEEGFELDTLSMGMSDDFEAAIAEGATIVRIGTAIFGERK